MEGWTDGERGCGCAGICATGWEGAAIGASGAGAVSGGETLSTGLATAWATLGTWVALVIPATSLRVPEVEVAPEVLGVPLRLLRAAAALAAALALAWAARAPVVLWAVI